MKKVSPTPSSKTLFLVGVRDMILRKPMRRQDFISCIHKDFGVFMVKLVVDLQREIIAYDALDPEICAQVERVFRLWVQNE
ncbi:MAG: hypothetical protein FWB88_03055 [Defluviitaleaceae bacterium]|nr:hypothetical protein [Defluviitaleaceae bacterium]MCL2238472.1 hypothetical protein [Defluviitaleaceae bacterium]